MILFIEGVSGVGKSTMVKALHKRLQDDGFTVKSYLEFDFTNPIDFYCTAYIPNERYRELCRSSPEIAQYSIPAGEATLVRYYDEDTPLFSENLMQELRSMEFCYDPPHPVPLSDYTRAYKAVWSTFDARIDGSVDYYIFDGSLLHHPLNDMIRNYHASKEQTAAHVRAISASLTMAVYDVFYLFTENIANQLRLAYHNRRQAPPDTTDISFWKTRGEYDLYVLENTDLRYQMMNVTKYGYDAVFNKILASVT